MAEGVVKAISRLGFPYETQDPFLFCVYHHDDYPAGDAKMQAPRRGNGADFDWSQPYRMYHGDRIPGFPQHPHRGFETLTTTLEGRVDHTDSMGNSGRYGDGDLQWMTAGSGIVHGEMFPLVHTDRPNPLKLFQIWLNLPAKNKMVPPAFVMHWAERIPKFQAPGCTVTVFAGELEGAKGLPPPPHSWAADPSNDVAVWHIKLDAGQSITLPAAKIGSQANRSLYLTAGAKVEVAGRALDKGYFAELRADKTAEIKAGSAGNVELLLLQGKPIGEPVAQHGPFVMNTKAEIMQAFSDYQKTQFGGWPWPQDAMVFPREKGRFAVFDGKEEVPDNPKC
eukprot:Tamp_22190.p1 GENE.Tamp_22190~~Tamp_22190.p1  ORF type:complete len:352 (-),score=53.00 Tamp_22190:46-1056(-)